MRFERGEPLAADRQEQVFLPLLIGAPRSAFAGGSMSHLSPFVSWPNCSLGIAVSPSRENPPPPHSGA